MAFDIKKAVKKAAKLTDLNKASKGGGNFTPPATGVPGLRFVSYIELGPQNETFKGKARVRCQVSLVFELHGKKWPLSENGQPQRITVKIAAPNPGEQPNEKSAYYKLFKSMNYENKFTHFAEMLGLDFVGTVYHRADKNDEKKVYAEFKDPVSGIINIRMPFIEDEEGEAKRRSVPAAISDLRLFLWSDPDADQWASIFIEGEYDGGKSKNRFQDAIKASPGYEGSPIEALLMGLDSDDDEPDDIEAAKAAAKADKKKKEKKADKPAKPEKEAKPKAKEKPATTPVSDDEEGDDPLADIGDD